MTTDVKHPNSSRQVLLWIGLSIFGLAAVISVAGSADFGQLDVIYNLLLVLHILVMGLCIYYFRSGGPRRPLDLLELPVFATLYMFITVLLPARLEFPRATLLTPAFKGNAVLALQAQFAYTVATAVLWIGYWFGGRLLRGKLANSSDISVSTDHIDQIFGLDRTMALFVVVVLVRLILFSLTGTGYNPVAGSDTFGFLQILSCLSDAIILVITILAVRTVQQRSALLWLVVVLAFQVLYSAWMGFIGTVLPAAIALLGGLDLGRIQHWSRRRILVPGLLVVILLMLAPGVGIYRGVVRATTSLADTAQSLQAAVSQSMQDGLVESVTDHLDTTILPRQASVLYTFGIVLDRTPYPNPYIGFRPLLSLLTIPIPRAIWPDKPSSALFRPQEFEYLYFDVNIDRGSSAVIAPAELYLMGGWRIGYHRHILLGHAFLCSL